MMDAQRKVAESVAKRGYRDGWTAEQFLARQACKLVEELAELTLTVAKIWPGGRLYWNWQQRMNIAGKLARLSFDDPAEWADVAVLDIKAAMEEAADMQVVLFNIAAAIEEATGQPWDIVQAAVDKASGDEARGVR
jgi:hypothetical protein